MIPAASFWLAITVLAAGTILIRYSIIGLAGKLKISDRLRELFSFIPAAIIPALVTPMVFFHQGHTEWLAGKERLIILLLAVALCWWTRSTLATIVFGLLALYLIS